MKNLIAILFVAALATSASAVVIFNGDFEIPATAAGTSTDSPSSAQDSFGWFGSWPMGGPHYSGRIGNPDMDAVGARWWPGGTAGNQSIRSRGNLVWQTDGRSFNVTPGETLIQSIDVCADRDTTQALVGKYYVLDVTIDEYLNYFDTLAAFPSGVPSDGWHHVSSTFVVPSSVASKPVQATDAVKLGYWLLNTAGQGVDHGLYQDNYQLTPEPMTLVLLGLGGIADLRRRR